MAYEEDIRARACGLRRDGLSVAQIAATLGGLPVSTVRGWVIGVPAPRWTTRPRAKDTEREEARRLRRQGLTYGEIASSLGVSKGSVSLWVRDLPRPAQGQAGVDARIAGLRRHFAAKRARDAAQREVDVAAGAVEIGELSERELLIAGAVAYWAEGSKAKPWRRSDRVVFTNSDPGMILLFTRFLAALGVEEHRLRFRIAIHVTADVDSATRYWSDLVGVPASRFQRPTLKRHVPQPGRRNTGDSYHGCLVIGVVGGAGVYRRIEGMWSAVAGTGASSLVPQSRVV